MITVFSTRSYVVQKHRELLDTLKWQEDAPVEHGFIQAFACEMNPDVMKEEEGVCTPLLQTFTLMTYLRQQYTKRQWKDCLQQ
jgi:hypothetical protein